MCQLVRTREGRSLCRFFETQDAPRSSLHGTVWNTRCIYEIRTHFRDSLIRGGRARVSVWVRAARRRPKFPSRSRSWRNGPLSSRWEFDLGAKYTPNSKRLKIRARARYIRFVRGFVGNSPRRNNWRSEKLQNATPRETGEFVCTARSSQVDGTFN